MRPTYENAGSLEAEGRFAADISFKCGVTLIKLPPKKYMLDFAVIDEEHDGLVMSFVELKCRQYDYGRFRDYMLSLEKYMMGLHLSAAAGVDFIVAVRFLDGDYMYRVVLGAVFSQAVKIRGRRDRNDESDIEPCCMIPLSQFEVITPLSFTC